VGPELDYDVEGLGPARDRTFLSGTLAEVDATARAIGVHLPRGVVCAPRAARAAVALARAAEGDVAAFPNGTVSTPGAFVFVPHGGGEVNAARCAAAPRVTFDAAERELPAIGGAPLRVADAWVFEVLHWSDLLWANLLALGPWLWSELAEPWRLAWAALRAGSLRPERVAGHLVKRAEGGFVHPHATVEFSVLGAGVTIGAGAVVRGCVLGPGAAVEELAVVEGCALGARARIQRQAMAKYSVIESGASHAGVVQLGVLGAGAEVRQGAVLFDQSLGDPVRVVRGGTLVEAPRGMIGVCVGPGTVLGQGVRVAAGRCLPGGLTILSDPDGVVVHVDVPAGATRMRAVGGRLEPIA
jgi:carbonic anhydrase/acetyltransferase-like protein (isoleucine patch superfamily)